MNFLKRAWKGEAKLWKVFWGGLLLQQLLCIAAGFMLGLFVALYAQGAGMDREASHDMISNSLHSAVFFLVLTAYFIALSICVWRCSWNASGKFWGVLARVVIIFITVCIFINVPMRLGKEHAVPQGQLNGITPKAVVPPTSTIQPEFDGVRHE